MLVPYIDRSIDREDATNKIKEASTEQTEKLEQSFEKKFKAVLEESGFPEPEQMKLLTEWMPEILPLLQELVQTNKVPNKKGEKGELEILDEYADLYPEDKHQHLGGPNDTDIVSLPNHNGKTLEPIMTESKMNSSGWKNAYIDQVKRHMKDRKISYAILAVQVMPKGADGHMVRHCNEGVIFVSSREYCAVTYGVLRSVLIGLEPCKKSPVDLQKVFADKRIDEPMRKAYGYVDFIRKIRQKAKKIRTEASGIDSELEEMDNLLRLCFKEFETRIAEALQQINDGSEGNILSERPGRCRRQSEEDSLESHAEPDQSIHC